MGNREVLNMACSSCNGGIVQIPYTTTCPGGCIRTVGCGIVCENGCSARRCNWWNNCNWWNRCGCCNRCGCGCSCSCSQDDSSCCCTSGDSSTTCCSDSSSTTCCGSSSSSTASNCSQCASAYWGY